MRDTLVLLRHIVAFDRARLQAHLRTARRANNEQARTDALQQAAWRAYEVQYWTAQLRALEADHA